MGINVRAENNLKQLQGIMDSLPAEISGWKKSAETVVYRPENLFKYINGGAELYISYHFKTVAARTYQKEGFPEVKVDIFDMGAPQYAFGVFSHSRETIDRFVAQDVESEYGGGLLTFWKGSYYVSVLAYPETGQKRDMVKQLARAIAAQIKEESAKPSVIALLPPDGLLPQSIRYFENYVWLNSHHYVSDKNILGIENGAQAVLAKYRLKKEEKQKTILLLVSYPDVSRASAAYAAFMKQFLPGATDGFKEAKGLWNGCRVNGKTLSIVFKAPERKQAEELLARIK